MFQNEIGRGKYIVHAKYMNLTRGVETAYDKKKMI